MSTPSSFVKRTTSLSASTPSVSGPHHALPPGCRLSGGPSPIPVLSSGIPSLDALLGDGIPAGSILLVREDWPRSSSNYSNTLLKCFLAEGLFDDSQNVLLVSPESKAEAFLAAVPAPTKRSSSSDDSASRPEPPSTDKLRIAWRYKHIADLDLAPEAKTKASSSFGHSFDLGKKLDWSTASLAKKRLVQIFNPVATPTATGAISTTCPFQSTINSITRFLHTVSTHKDASQAATRIAIQSFLSPHWGFIPDLSDPAYAAVRAIHQLRLILKGSRVPAIAIITLPAYLYQSSSPQWLRAIERLCDGCIELTAWLGDRPLMPQVDGFVRLLQPFRYGTLRPAIPDTANWSFSISRRQLVFEKFHLPPEFDDSATLTPSNPPHSACGSSSSNALSSSSTLDF